MRRFQNAITFAGRVTSTLTQPHPTPNKHSSTSTPPTAQPLPATLIPHLNSIRHPSEPPPLVADLHIQMVQSQGLLWNYVAFDMYSACFLSRGLMESWKGWKQPVLIQYPPKLILLTTDLKTKRNRIEYSCRYQKQRVLIHNTTRLKALSQLILIPVLKTVSVKQPIFRWKTTTFNLSPKEKGRETRKEKGKVKDLTLLHTSNHDRRHSNTLAMSSIMIDDIISKSCYVVYHDRWHN